MKLSICIPTYNRARFLEETLVAFLPLLGEDVQIVISDNASIDDTEVVVQSFRLQFPQVIYHRWPENMGADRNYLKVVEMAEGEYCWLFGSDDLPTFDSIGFIREAMATGCDIALFNCMWCDFYMRPFRRVHALNHGVGPTFFRISGPESLDAYLGQVRCVAGFFSYLSVILFRRSRWVGAPYDSRFTGGAYSHAAILMTVLRDGAALCYDPRIVVNTRHGNDSFALEGMFKRVMIDLNGYAAIRDIIFPADPRARAHFDRVLRQDYPWWYIAKLGASMDSGELEELLGGFREIRYSPIMLALARRGARYKAIFRGLAFLKSQVWVPICRRFL